MEKRYKVIIGGFQEESNSFTKEICDEKLFRLGNFIFGQEVIELLEKKSTGLLGGIYQEAKDRNAEIIPACALGSCKSSGKVDHRILELFIQSILETFDKNQDVDAVLLAMHGATQTTEEDDACGFALEKIRQKIGRDKVLTVACDLHANVTPKFIRNADYVCGYQEYPHIDRANTGRRSVKLAFDHLNGIKRHTAYIYNPMIVPACGYTTKEGKLLSIMQTGHKAVSEGKIADFTVFQMQPWLDVEISGSAIIAISEDEKEAKALVQELASRVFAIRKEMWPKLEETEDVIDKARNAEKGKPVILVDFSDSTGAGSKGDNVSVLRSLSEQDYPVSAGIMLTAPEAVKKAFEAGVGSEAEFDLGSDDAVDGKGRMHVRATVQCLDPSGDFTMNEPSGEDQIRDLRKTALLRVKDVYIIACGQLKGCSDPEIFRRIGVEPAELQLVSVKANTSFRAAYESFAGDICYVDTLGSSSSKLRELPFVKIPKDFYPFSEMDDYNIPEPELVR